MIIREDVQWPGDMSPEFQGLLHGLLQKDPHKRLSWPHLLYHPFIASGETSNTKSLEMILFQPHRARHRVSDAVC